MGGSSRATAGGASGEENRPGHRTDDAVDLERRPVRVGEAGLKEPDRGRRRRAERAADGKRPAAGLVQPALDLPDERGVLLAGLHGTAGNGRALMR